MWRPVGPYFFTPLEKDTDEAGGESITADSGLMSPPVCVQRTGRSVQAARSVRKSFSNRVKGSLMGFT